MTGGRAVTGRRQRENQKPRFSTLLVATIRPKTKTPFKHFKMLASYVYALPGFADKNIKAWTLLEHRTPLTVGNVADTIFSQIIPDIEGALKSWFYLHGTLRSNLRFSGSACVCNVRC